MRALRFNVAVFTIFGSLLVFSGHSIATEASAKNSYNVYLVRHAEKQKTDVNPHLTKCGAFRAKQLATIFKNVELQAIYSTSYNRTMETVTPTAQSKSLAIKQYSPNGLEQLSHLIQQRKENALIVGHSNTTPYLTSLLANTDIGKMSESEYQHLFQIQVNGTNTRLVKLTQPLDCSGYD